MSKIIFLFGFAVSVLSSQWLVAAPQKKTVVVEANLKADRSDDKRFTLVVALDIQEGWHVYGSAADDSGTPTTIRLELPGGAKKRGDWDEPLGELKSDSLETTIHKDRVEYSCTLEIGDTKGDEIGIIVGYQACTDEYCNPPTDEKLTLEIPERGASDDIFEAPVRLLADGKPLDHKSRFPSPAVCDVDDDGMDELVVGSLRGTLGVFENSNGTGKGDPVWGKRKDLRDSSGQIIRIKNW